VLDPDRDGDGADAPALALKVGQHPAPLSLLDGLDVKLGQLIPPQRAADQQRQDDVIAFAFQGRAVRDRQQLFGLLAGQPVPQTSSLLADVGDVGQAGRLLLPNHAGAPGLADHFAHGREPDVYSRRGQRLHRCPPLH
jgi:hypothetical protein